jgi:nucleotide-binding universal stress UspA family protein
MVLTLIIPLVGSMEPVDALPLARAAVQTFGGRLVLLRAVPYRHPHVSRAEGERVMLQLERVAQELRDEGIAAEAQVRRAEPEAAIVDAVREFDASAIVRSGYERHDLAGWLRGTIVDEATRKTHTPVLIVPASGAPAPAPGSRLRVLVPLDGSALAESALVHVLRIAGSRPLEIRLIEVVHLGLGPLGVPLPSLPGLEAERRATRRYLHDVAAALRAEGVTAHTDVIKSPDSVARVLLALAQRSVVDIIAMTTRGVDTLSQLPLGTVATEVLERSPVPVLLAPRRPVMEDADPLGQRGRSAVVEVAQP